MPPPLIPLPSILALQYYTRLPVKLTADPQPTNPRTQKRGVDQTPGTQAYQD